MGTRKCQVCNEALSKYKCPSCLAPYCSLSCYKKHKEVPCAKPDVTSVDKSSSGSHSLVERPEEVDKKNELQHKSQLEAIDPISDLLVERPINVDEPNEVLQKLQLDAIASSTEIHDAFKDETVQRLIRAVDSSPDAMNELDKAMETEAFRIFSDKILSTISGPYLQPSVGKRRKQ